LGHLRFLRYASLVFLTLQNVVVVLMSRYVRSQPGDMFIASTAVAMSEIVKFVVCLGLVWFMEEKGSIRGFLSNIRRNLLSDWRDNLLIGVPGVIYAIQNNLIYVAVSHLNPSVFQVTYQLKVFTTVIFFRLILHRVLTSKHWIALSLLFVGVIVAQVDPQNATVSSVNSRPDQSPVYGFICVIVACFLSGFSGVFFELVLKSTQKTIVLRNIQLSIYGIVASTAQAFIQEKSVIVEHGFFFGYNKYVWFVILLQSLGGLLVAAVVRYADNILKTFATSVAIVLTLVASVLLFNTALTMHLAFGNILVIGATVMYGMLPPPRQVAPIAPILVEEDRRPLITNDDSVVITIPEKPTD
uniref:UDP-galactose translocator n=1 Tax=Rodentolepis nana TaxID=102285 RepID=A0A158QH25_RODNA